jgi:hypothetical protein
MSYTVYSIQLGTTGFGITSLNPDTPFNVSAGSQKTESLEISTPDHSYNGNLTIMAYSEIVDPPSNTDPPPNTTNTISLNSIIVKTVYSSNGIYGNTTMSFTGANESAGSSFPYKIRLSNSRAANITVNSITSGTSGFVLDNIAPSLPRSIPSESSANESFTVQTPSAPYSGNLTILVYETGK